MMRITSNQNFPIANFQATDEAGMASQYSYRPPEPSAREVFIKEHKKNGLFERLYNVLKNVTGLGIGSKKALKAVGMAENGEISEKEANDVIKKYRNSQANSEQIAGDAISIAATAPFYFKIRKALKYHLGLSKLNEKANQSMSNGLEAYDKIFKFIGKSKFRFFIVTAGLAGATAGGVKSIFSMFNGIGSTKYKVNKKDYNNLETSYDKRMYKIDKKIMRNERIKNYFRDVFSGTINGLMLPLTLIGGGFIGAPLYAIGNSLNRYFVGNKTGEDKNFNAYLTDIKNDAVLTTALGVGAAIPLAKKGNFLGIYEKNLGSAVEKLSKAHLKPANLQGKTAYDELNDILMDSPSICNIIWHGEYDSSKLQDTIKKLTEENIFAVKMEQIKGNGNIAMELKENCPASRTLDQAADKIKNTFGNRYDCSSIKCLGVGTVAETYLVKGSDGKEACIKMIKEGITQEKIITDYNKFKTLIENSNKTLDQKEYLKKNLVDLKDGILKEIDLANEKAAAEKLAKYTHTANVVKPIEVKDGLYVMEKANGISLESFMNLHTAQMYLNALESGGLLSKMLTRNVGGTRLRKLLGNCKTKSDKIKVLNEEIERIKAKTPQFKDMELSDGETRYMLNEYAQVITEQLNKFEKGGRVLHADIHPGNIFIDIDAVKKHAGKTNVLTKTMDMAKISRIRNNKVFTLIDTGNVIELSPEISAKFIKLSSFIDRGSYKDIAEYFVEGATLPKNLTKEAAIEKIGNELKEIFLGMELKPDKITNESLGTMVNNIMRKLDILPADTQLNLNKARVSANGSYEQLENALALNRTTKMRDSFSGFLSGLANVVTDYKSSQSYLNNVKARQEKANLRQMTKEEARKYKKNPNLLAPNSEDYLVYKLKQDMKLPPQPSFWEDKIKTDMPPKPPFGEDKIKTDIPPLSKVKVRRS